MDDFDQEFIAEMLASEKAEALTWLQARTEASFNNLGEMTWRDSVEFVEQLYRLGAVQVIAADIQEDVGGANSISLLIQLPTEADARLRLFNFNNDYAHRLGYDHDVDEGKEYLYLRLS